MLAFQRDWLLVASHVETQGFMRHEEPLAAPHRVLKTDSAPVSSDHGDGLLAVLGLPQRLTHRVGLHE